MWKDNKTSTYLLIWVTARSGEAAVRLAANEWEGNNS